MRWYKALAIFLFLATVKTQDDVDFDFIEVSTPSGFLRGYISSNNNVTYSAFLGIPYAQPPVGPLRFEPAQPFGPWEGIRDALDFGDVCTQAYDPTGDVIPSEDCLFMDIWITGNASDAAILDSPQLPVMVWIHGGGYTLGGTREYTGTAFTTIGEPVVLVVIQYRLGIMGFMSTGTDEIPGEQALKDQVFALQWVQDNIEYFGGDKNQVTIFGESAGGDSILMHMISPMSSGLFHRAIAQSAPLSWRHPRKELYRDYVYNTALENGCTEANLQECIRTIPWEDMLAMFQYLPLRVIDGEFLQEEPWWYYNEGYINDAELIIGFNSEDGDDILYYFMPEDFQTEGITDVELYQALLAYLLEAHLTDKSLMGDNDYYNAVSNADINVQNSFNYTIGRYGKGLVNMDSLMALLNGKYNAFGDPIQNAKGILDAATDAIFVTWPIWVALQASKHGSKPVRLYEFDHRTPLLYGVPGPDEVPRGAPHAGELAYVFGYPFNAFVAVPLEEEEAILSASMIKAWTTFATDGNPVYYTHNGTEEAWPEFTPAQQNYIVWNTDLSAESVKDFSTTYMPRVEFWLALDSLALFEGDLEDYMGSSEDSSSSSEEFETNMLKLDENQADLAVIILGCCTLMLVIVTLLMCCVLCGRASSDKYEI